MEVAPGIHRIEAPLGERFVAFYLLIGDTCALLIDTGFDAMPRDIIAPYMDSISVPLSKLRYVINSHIDFDHTGGNATMRELAPHALFMCHELDRAQVEDVELMISDRYGQYAADHGIDESADAKVFIRAQSRHIPIDIGLTGGERIRLSADWVVDILHTAGHSLGHLTIYDPRSKTAVICDAALWNAVLTKTGAPAFPPTYRYVDTYLATIHRLQGMTIDTLLTCHYPVYRGDDVAIFLGESAAFVERVEAALRGVLMNASHPLTMREIIDHISASLGKWPDGTYLVWPLQGHLERLLLYGLVKTGRRDGLQTFQWAARERAV